MSKYDDTIERLHRDGMLCMEEIETFRAELTSAKTPEAVLEAHCRLITRVHAKYPKTPYEVVAECFCCGIVDIPEYVHLQDLAEAGLIEDGHAEIRRLLLEIRQRIRAMPRPKQHAMLRDFARRVDIFEMEGLFSEGELSNG